MVEKKTTTKKASRAGARPGPKTAGKRPYQRRTRKEPKPVIMKEERKKNIPPLKLFGRWDSNVTLTEPGLKRYINLEPRFLPRSAGIHRSTFHKSRMHITERLALHILVPGHQGKRHRLTSGRATGKFDNALQIVEDALAEIEKKEKKNPIEVLVKAIENSALREEIISYQLGSIMAREGVITAPQRRVDKTLRSMAQGAYRAAFNKRIKMGQALAKEIIAASNSSNDSNAMREKERVEREAASAR